jgi:DNA-binding transcriptional ArsR family regulator
MTKEMIMMSLQQTTKAIADPTRRGILSLLKQGRMSAGDIVAHFNMTGAAISKHLTILKEADLIRDEREGKFIFYELNTSVLEDILCWIAEIREGEKND